MKFYNKIKLILFLSSTITFLILNNCFATEQPIQLKKINSINAPIIVKQAPPKAAPQKALKKAKKPPTKTASVQTISQPTIDFAHCNKTFKLDFQRLFYLTLAAINANRFKIDEIQSKSGYILFSTTQKQFLASIISINSQTSMLKITPCDNIYIFPLGIVQNLFKYIELNLKTPIQKLNTM